MHGWSDVFVVTEVYTWLSLNYYFASNARLHGRTCSMYHVSGVPVRIRYASDSNWNLCCVGQTGCSGISQAKLVSEIAISRSVIVYQ